MSDISAVTYTGGAVVTQSDTTADPAGPFAALHNPGAANTCTITTVSGTKLTVYLTQGGILEIATQRVWSTGGIAGVIGLHAMPYKGNAT